MALPLSNTFETGLADETTITTGNSGDGTAGDAFDVVFGSPVYDSARSSHGTLSMRCDTAGVSARYVGYSTSHGAETTMWGRAYVYRTNTPSGDVTNFVRALDSSSDIFSIGWYLDGNMYTYIAGLSSPTAIGPVNNNEWIRVEWKVICHATTGSTEVRLYAGDSTSEFDSQIRSNVNTGAEIDETQIGSTFAQNVGSSTWVDGFALSDTDWIGPAVEPDPGPTLHVVRSSLRW